VTTGEENPSWDEGRIEDELSLKLGILVDSRTVGKYMKDCNALGDRLAAMECTFWKTATWRSTTGPRAANRTIAIGRGKLDVFPGGITAARLRPSC